jgi:hydrogenase/urease accessory protein HupE
MCDFAPDDTTQREHTMRTGLIQVFAFVATLVPAAALAHPGHGEPHPFVHGFAYPFGSIDYTLAALTVGLLAWHLVRALKHRTPRARFWRRRP